MSYPVNFGRVGPFPVRHAVTLSKFQLRCGREPQLGEFKELSPHGVRSRAPGACYTLLSVLAIFGRGAHRRF
jgi:hypothetical protein